MSEIHFLRVNEPLQRSTSESTSKTTRYESKAIRQGLKQGEAREVATKNQVVTVAHMCFHLIPLTFNEGAVFIIALW